MALETVTHISDLVATNPTSTDPKSEGDNHLRNIKTALLTDLPGITGPVTATQTELNILDGATLSTAELNVLDGITATTAELNFTDGVTSNIQTQLDGKQPLDADLTAVAGLAGAGLIARTGAGTAAARMLTAGAGVTITNGDGVAGNPTIAVSAGVGLGDVLGPVSSTDNAIARYDLTTGKLLQNSTVTVGDAGEVAGVASMNGGQLAGLRSPIINGLFSINQRAPSTNADDTYAHDRWYALTQTGTIAVTTLSDVENSTPFMARLTQSQASAQRMGYAQIIEGKNCKHLRGQQVTFRFGRTRLSSSANVRFAVLEWTGTEDTVTSDVVLDWTSSTYTAGNFFLASNLTVSGVVQQALTANTLTDGSSVTVTLGSSFNNLIVFAWTESTVAQNVTLDLGKAQIETGATATPFEIRGYGIELALCQRYYYRNTTSGVDTFGVAQAFSTTQAYISVYFPVVLRTSPASLDQTGVATDYSISGSNCNAVPVINGASNENIGVATFSLVSGLTTNGCYLGLSTGSGKYLGWSAEL